MGENIEPLIIGFSGKIGTGKNYIAENILPELLPEDVVPFFIAYGDQLKVEVYSRDKEDKLNYENLYIKKNTESRQKLQEYGTEIRNLNGENTWINAIDMWINIYKNRWAKKNQRLLFIITDVRYNNEAKYILENNGFLINIIAPKRNLQKLQQESCNDNDIMDKIASHKSETALDNFGFDYTINNDPENEIYIKDKLSEILLEKKIIYEQHPNVSYFQCMIAVLPTILFIISLWIVNLI